MGCNVMDQDANGRVVHITPIITRANVSEITELGVGGGKGDLDPKEELETSGSAEVGKLMELCTASISDETTLGKVFAILQQAFGEDGKLDLDMHLQNQGEDTQDGLTLHSLVSVLAEHASRSSIPEQHGERTIQFPYSRHSSYSELRELIETFNPIDVFPCTVDEKRWTPEVSMESLFGDLCYGKLFRHDIEMMEVYNSRITRERRKRRRDDSQTNTQTTEDRIASPVAEGISTFIKGLEFEGPVTPTMTTSTMEITTISGTAQVSNTLPTPEAPGVRVLEVLEPEHVPIPKEAEDTFSISAANMLSKPSVPTAAPSNAVVLMPSSCKGRRKLKFRNKEIAGLAAKRKYDLDCSDIGLVSTRSKANQ